MPTLDDDYSVDCSDEHRAALDDLTAIAIDYADNRATYVDLAAAIAAELTARTGCPADRP